MAILIVMFGLFAFAQKVKADQEAERTRLASIEAQMQRDVANAAQAEAVEMLALAGAQKQIADVEHERANSLQQQLDKCK